VDILLHMVDSIAPARPAAAARGARASR